MCGRSVCAPGHEGEPGGCFQLSCSRRPSISTKGSVLAPGVRRYQARYRNSAAFCTAETFNYTNAVEILWVN
jgi:hypothetical protein